MRLLERETVICQTLRKYLSSIDISRTEQLKFDKSHKEVKGLAV